MYKMKLNYSVLLILSLVVDSIATECNSNSDCDFLQECSTYRCENNFFYDFLFYALIVVVVVGLCSVVYIINEKIQNRKTDQEREERQNYEKVNADGKINALDGTFAFGYEHKSSFTIN